MNRIRILLAEMPRMLREIVESAVSPQPDMQIVGSTPARVVAPGAAPPRMVDADADVVIVGLARAEEARAYDPVLFQRPHLRILAITGDGRGAFLYELRPQAVPIGDVSPQGLVDAIRASAAAKASEAV